MVKVTIANVTTSKITLNNVPEETTREELNELIADQTGGTDPSKLRIGTRSLGEFKRGMELADFGSQQHIYLEKLT